MQNCELCSQAGGELLWEDAQCRIVRVADTHFHGFCRVIWKAHVREMSDLSIGEQQHFMRIVFALEKAIRTLFSPDKINLASLGNVVPHLHWHVIPRWHDDRCFPDPIWAPPRRETHLPPGRSAVNSTTLATVIRQTIEGCERS